MHTTPRLTVAASVCAAFLGLCTALTVPAVSAAVFGGGGLGSGIGQASGIAGLSSQDPKQFIQSVIDVAVSFLQLAGLVAITVAGFYLILGFGSDSAKDKAKNIIIYTAIGLVIVTVADIIVDFFSSLGTGAEDPGIRDRVLAVLDIALSYLNLAAVIVIVTAGFYLILGFGSDSAKDKAKNMIIYTVVGLIVVVLAQVIVDLAISLGEGAGAGQAAENVRAKILDVLLTALSFLNLIAVIAVIVAGFYLVLSGGNDEAKEKAKKIILYVIIGLLIVFFARVIVGFVTEALAA
ncbi:hypothetical protein HYZ99_04310 [Candidatus Peregrinibacteria bacterium]|nr:hypothetical protein [Candidatus Peregrinibacteria bacterium]